MLADTLALAAREKPALIIDYATLTGTCVVALTERYSGVFSNRAPPTRCCSEAGAASGERVWPFPMDDDYDELLKSDVADIKQCSAESAGDHILGARFLSRFVPKAIPWIHRRLERRAAQRRPRSRADRNHGLRRAADGRAADAGDGGAADLAKRLDA